MASRMEDRERESLMQELNTMIAVRLVSGVKSEVEGLRWVLTRFAAIGVLIVGGTVLALIRMLSSKKRTEKDKEKVAVVVGGTSSTVPSREMGTQTQDSGTGTGEEALFKGMDQGGNPGLVSLG